MSKRSCSYLSIIPLLCLLVFAACKNKRRSPGAVIAQSPQELQQKATDLIRSILEYAVADNNTIDDSTTLNQLPFVQMLYEKIQFSLAWSREEKWQPLGDSLYDLIANAKLYGLFPEDYHSRELSDIRTKFSNDSAGKGDRKNATLWSQADLMLTDAFVRLIKDLKLGRLSPDSITLRKDSVLTNEFCLQQYNSLQQSGSLAQLVQSLEPEQPGYHLLKAGIKKCLDSADNRQFTKVPPRGGNADTFKLALQHRLYEEGFIASDSVRADSVQLSKAIMRFQKKKEITADGKAGEGTIRMLNTSDHDKFIRIAITLDRYKLLPEKMPEKYIWVNLPGFYLQLWNDDSVIIVSKIVCGKPQTRTPVLTSAISELITYPQWTMPTSIIVKEILPAVKKNPGYLARKGFSLIDSKGDEADPYKVNWSKYSKGIPYKVVQGSGDDNALGVMKFNFSNKYAVYLHDTNQRYLFGQASRAMSHGCVRVQEWQKMAYYILRNDSTLADKGSYPLIDSMNTWLKRKEKHSIKIRNRIPLFIRYFTCDGKNGNIVFYDDIYGEDNKFREKYFAGK